jgi:regulatory protein
MRRNADVCYTRRTSPLLQIPMMDFTESAPPATARITALREHPRRAGRYVIELDGSPLGALSVERIADHALAVGRMVDTALREKLERAVREVACYDKALDTLARRARSAADLARWLKEKEFTVEEIEPAIARLAALGLLDDLAYARGFARTRLGAGRGFGPRRVAMELGRKGVARDIVELVLRELADEEGGGDERTAAEAVALRRVRGMSKLEPEVRQRRLYGFLVRRGFAMGLSADIARRLSR